MSVHVAGFQHVLLTCAHIFSVFYVQKELIKFRCRCRERVGSRNQLHFHGIPRETFMDLEFVFNLAYLGDWYLWVGAIRCSFIGFKHSVGPWRRSLLNSILVIPMAYGMINSKAAPGRSGLLGALLTPPLTSYSNQWPVYDF